MINSRSTAQLNLLQICNAWLNNKAGDIQGFEDRNDRENFYDGVKEVCGPTTSGSSPLFSGDESTLTSDKEKILERWAEPFDSVPNHPSSINDEAIRWLPQASLDEALNAVPTFEEIRKAIHLLSSGKASGADSIPAGLQRR